MSQETGFGCDMTRKKMILTEHEVQQAIKQAETAFPNFADWEYNNDETNKDYFGFSLWGEYTPDPEEDMPRHFYITFDFCEEKWGVLSIGQHSYFWSSADCGDAYLLNTESCNTLEDAIVALKAEMAALFRGFSAI